MEYSELKIFALERIKALRKSIDEQRNKIMELRNKFVILNNQSNALISVIKSEFKEGQTKLKKLEEKYNSSLFNKFRCSLMFSIFTGLAIGGIITIIFGNPIVGSFLLGFNGTLALKRALSFKKLNEKIKEDLLALQKKQSEILSIGLGKLKESHQIIDTMEEVKNKIDAGLKEYNFLKDREAYYISMLKEKDRPKEIERDDEILTLV